MNLAIIGYGKMGHEIEQIAKEKGYHVITIDPQAFGATFKTIDKNSLQNVDVCIDFTTPAVVLDNIKKIAALKKNVVVGTTGWYDQLSEVKKIVKTSGIGFLYASNFSLGINLFFAMVENAAHIMNTVEEYDVFSYELHHNQKTDSPSGTAKSIGNILLKNIHRKKTLQFEKLDRKIKPEELHIASVRAGHIPGTHVIGFDSAADTIELKHTARNRSGFALGAVLAAQWLHKKKGFYEIQDFMKSIIH